MINPWDKENPETFLDILRTTSAARNWCRSGISELVKARRATSICEVGFGGLNERIALAKLRVAYKGIDGSSTFVEHARKMFPKDFWIHGNIITGVETADADIVYSQHVLEHLPGLNPGLRNMLSLTRDTLLNIFFLPPVDGPEQLCWYHYPIYHNVYSREHIRKVCDAHGFDCELRDFSNAEFMHLSDPGKAPIPAVETVLIATRRK